MSPQVRLPVLAGRLILFDTTMSDSQFRKLSSVIYNVSGISINESKMNLLKARLAKRLRATRIDSISDYINEIQKDPLEFERFIDGITTNHTYFFRENAHCEFLLKNLDKNRYIKFWSAASSSGEEAYSIAIQFQAAGFKFDVYGSDISDTMIEAARKGVYPIERLRAVPPNIVQQYFKRGRNKYAGMVKIKEIIQSHVDYGKHNIVYGDPPKASYDVIFCRNVMIYFDLKTKQKIIDDMFGALKAGGYFIFGQSESVVGLKTNFNSILPSIYQKPYR